MISHSLKTMRHFELVVLAEESKFPAAPCSWERMYTGLCVYEVQVKAGSWSISKSCSFHHARYHLYGMGSQPGDTFQVLMRAGHTCGIRVGVCEKVLAKGTHL